MPEIINLRPRHSQSQLVLPYLPMPVLNAGTKASTTSSPAAATPIQQHPRYATLLNWINQRLVHPNPHLREIFHTLLREFDKLP